MKFRIIAHAYILLLCSLIIFILFITRSICHYNSQHLLTHHIILSSKPWHAIRYASNWNSFIHGCQLHARPITLAYVLIWILNPNNAASTWLADINNLHEFEYKLQARREIVRVIHVPPLIWTILHRTVILVVDVVVPSSPIFLLCAHRPRRATIHHADINVLHAHRLYPRMLYDPQ